MLCELRKIASLNDATADLIEKFFQDDARNKTPSPQKLPKSTLLTPPDDYILGAADQEDEGDDLAESDTGIKALVAESTCERSESDLPADHERRWLKTSLIVASHNLDLLVIAAVQKFIVLQKSCINKNRFEPIARVTLKLNDAKESVYITSVLPLCIASTRPTDSTNIDWTCICVGLSDGNIHFYTEHGVCVFIEKCSNSAISALRFGPSIYASHQELIALTNRNKLIVMEGLSLSVTLRTARNKIALGEKTLRELSDTLVLNCHCIELDGNRHVNDFVDLGVTKVSNFDQYINASCSSAGRDASPSRNALPVFTAYFCAHEDMFGSFEWHSGEVPVSELLGEVLYSLTSQVTNVLPSIGLRSMLGIGTSRKDRPPKTCAMDARRYRSAERSSILDYERKAERCYMSPVGWNLLAIADSCARVLLIDTEKRCVVRIWKGYRHARCAWVESAATDEIITNKGARVTYMKARTLFLVIFAPKRALLEVWTMQNGPRVAAFNVHEKGRLLTIETAERGTLLGSTSPNIFGYSHNYTTTAFLFPDGSIFELRVPFHLSALDVSVSAIHDENLLKAFKIAYLLRVDSSDENATLAQLNLERCISQCTRLNSVVARKRFVDLIANYVQQRLGSNENDDGEERKQSMSTPPISLDNFNNFIDRLRVVLQEDRLHASDAFLRYLDNYSLFLRISIVIKRLNADKVAPLEIDYTKLRETFKMTEKAFEELELPLIRDCLPGDHTRCPRLSLKSFREQFAFDGDSQVNALSSENSVVEKLSLKSDGFSNAAFGAMLFGPFVCGSAETSTFFSDILPLLEMTTERLLEIYVDFWLDSKWNVDPQRWSFGAVEMLSSIIMRCDSKKDYTNLVNAIEKKVFESESLYAAFLLCLQLRVARIRRIEHLKVLNESSTIDDYPEKQITCDHLDAPFTYNDESFSFIDDDDLLHYDKDSSHSSTTELFDLYIQQLKIFTLIRCLPWNYKGIKPSSYVNKKRAFTLETFARKREGFYREQIGLWCVAHRPDPVELAHILTGIETPTENSSETESLSSSMRNIIKTLRRYLPETLRPELTLCDCCWECASAWSRDEARRCTFLKLTVEYLEQLSPVPRLQHGLIAKLWTTFLLESFRNLYKILNESDDDINQRFHPISSKDRLLKRDVFITETDLPEYVECVREMLRVLADAAANLCSGNPEGTPVVGCSYDPIVNDFFAHSKIRCVILQCSQLKSAGRYVGKNSRKFEKACTLSDMVRKVKAVNYHLVLHHKHLASVMSLIVRVGISLRLDSLFDAVGQMAMFEALDSHPLINIANVDDRLRTRRQNFLEMVVEHVSMNGKNSKDEEFKLRWALIIGLAKDWELNIPSLRRKEISVLYQYGFDNDAEYVMSKMKDKQALVDTLLPIIAGRIKFFMEEDAKLNFKFYQCGAVTDRFKYVSKVGDKFSPKFPDVTVDNLKRLIANAMAFMYSRTKKPSDLEAQRIIQIQIELVQELSSVVEVIERFYKPK